MSTGRRIVVASWVGTALFAVSAVAAAAVPSVFEALSVAVALVLFALGCGAFLWAYGIAISRSRFEVVSIGGVFLLTGAPVPVRLNLLGSLGAQVVVALVTASVRPFTGLAFGVLVPMLGLGPAGLWGARYGSFPDRPDTDETGR